MTPVARKKKYQPDKSSPIQLRWNVIVQEMAHTKAVTE